MRHIRPLITLVALVCIILACGLPAGGDGDAPQAGTTPEEGGLAQVPTEAVNEVPGEAPGEPFLNIPGIGQVSLLTDVQGGGEFPLFVWEPVSGADRYQLVVFDETGEPYWAWEGIQTQVYMGGSENPPPADSSSPAVSMGYTWAVVAYDASGQILASSALQPISP